MPAMSEHRKIPSVSSGLNISLFLSSYLDVSRLMFESYSGNREICFHRHSLNLDLTGEAVDTGRLIPVI